MGNLLVRRILSRAALASVCLLLFALIALLVTRAVRQHQISAATRVPVPPGIDSLEKLKLGGVAQWIQIRGHDRTLPLLLMLHGGPGLPEMPYSYVNAELEKHFIVVQWDQRGAGKSFRPNIPEESMRVDRFVSDARELTGLLCRRFDQKQIFIAGHSSGSVIGALLAARHPELVRAYIGVSQVANLQESQTFLYQFATRSAQAKGNSEASRELEQIGPPPFATAKQLRVSQKWVNAFAPDRFAALSLERVQLALASPAYTLPDLLRFVSGAKSSFDRLWRELFAVDLFKQVPRIDVPVYFFQGRHDRVATGEIAEKYFRALDAPRGKHLIWFDGSGHWPQLEEPEKFRREMIDHVLGNNPK